MYLTLSVLIAPNQGLAGQLSHTFDTAGGTVGRAASCDFVLPDPNKTISGRHATISYASGQFVITDTSTNGTYYGPNGTPLKRGQTAAIENGVQIRIGGYTLVARLEAAPGQGRVPGYTGPSYPELSSVRAPSTDLLGESLAPRRSVDTDPFGDLLGSSPVRRAGTAAPSGYAPAVAASPTGFDDLIRRNDPAPQNELLPGSQIGVRTAASYPQGSASPPYGRDDPFQGLAAQTGQGVPAGYDPYAQPRPAAPVGTDFIQPVTAVPPTPTPIATAVPMESRSFAPQPQQSSPASSTSQPSIIPDSLSLDDLLGPDTPAPAPRAGDVEPAALQSLDPDPIAASPVVPDPLPIDPAPYGPSDGVAAQMPADGGGVMPDVTPIQPSAPVAGTPAAYPSPAPGPMPPMPATTPPRDLAPQFKPDLVTLADDLAAGVGTPEDGDERAKVLDPVSVLKARAKSRHSVLPDTTLFGARTTPPGSGDGDAIRSLVAEAFSLSENDMATYSTEDLKAMLVDIVRAATDGIVQVLAARKLVKDEFRIESTRLRPDENNAFKFAKNGAEALRYAIDPKGGFLPPGRALSEAFNDLKAHEMAAIQAVQASLSVVLGRLAPERIEAEAASSSSTSLIARASGTSGPWQRYRTLHGQLSEDLDRTTRQLISEEFSRAYKAHLDALNAGGGGS